MADYRHFELEEDGEVGTAFYNKGIEGRLELVEAKRNGWQGASGVQFFNRDFDVQGDEAFLPRNNTAQVGLFTLQQLDRGAFKMEAGARYEHTTLTARTAVTDDRFFRGQRDFNAFSGSIGASYGFAPDWRAGLNLSRTERAPSAEELFANGPMPGPRPMNWAIRTSRRKPAGASKQRCTGMARAIASTPRPITTASPITSMTRWCRRVLASPPRPLGS